MGTGRGGMSAPSPRGSGRRLRKARPNYLNINAMSQASIEPFDMAAAIAASLQTHRVEQERVAGGGGGSAGGGSSGDSSRLPSPAQPAREAARAPAVGKGGSPDGANNRASDSDGSDNGGGGRASSSGSGSGSGSDGGGSSGSESSQDPTALLSRRPKDGGGQAKHGRRRKAKVKASRVGERYQCVVLPLAGLGAGQPQLPSPPQQQRAEEAAKAGGPLGVGEAEGKLEAEWASWSEAEAAAFGAGVLQHGKDFGAIHAGQLPQRSTQQLVLYYYAKWKGTEEYVAWKGATTVKHNRDLCERCGRAGILVCCDGCPASYHFGCCSPRLSALSLPPSWHCEKCDARRQRWGLQEPDADAKPAAQASATAAAKGQGGGGVLGGGNGVSSALAAKAKTADRAADQAQPQPQPQPQAGQGQGAASTPTSARPKAAPIDISDGALSQALLLKVRGSKRDGGVQQVDGGRCPEAYCDPRCGCCISANGGKSAEELARELWNAGGAKPGGRSRKRPSAMLSLGLGQGLNLGLDGSDAGAAASSLGASGRSRSRGRAKPKPRSRPKPPALSALDAESAKEAAKASRQAKAAAGEIFTSKAAGGSNGDGTTGGGLRLCAKCGNDITALAPASKASTRGNHAGEHYHVRCKDLPWLADQQAAMLAKHKRRQEEMARLGAVPGEGGKAATRAQPPPRSEYAAKRPRRSAAASIPWALVLK